MKNILEEIAARTTERIAKEKAQVSVSELENRIQEINKNALQKDIPAGTAKDGMSYICEVKKASPSRGLLHRTSHIWQSRRNMNRQEQAQSPASQNLFTFRVLTSI